MKLTLIWITLAMLLGAISQEYPLKIVLKNEMKVSWNYQQDRIFFEISAPTDGWVAIGFNAGSDLTGAYLLMGRVVAGEVEVVEYVTLSPGDYRPITTMGEQSQVAGIRGMGNAMTTQLRFSIPIQTSHAFRKDLSEGAQFTMTMAFSRSKDFQHHSVMRTSVEVTL